MFVTFMFSYDHWLNTFTLNDRMLYHKPIIGLDNDYG